MAQKSQITKSSSAEYFAKNLQQVGFSSFTKATLTSIKEAIDNSLDACEDARVLPEIWVEVEKLGTGTSKGSDLIRVFIKDNGPGIPVDDIVNVFGQYLASSKFGRGRCSRGQQGIGISAVTTWAQLTHGTGVTVVSKTKKARLAQKLTIEVDIKNNKGLIKKKESIEWDQASGTSCEFIMDARVQLNGEGGLLTYLQGTALVNPHLTLHYKLLDNEAVTVERVSKEVPAIPEPTEPHPHTLKLGEFITHARLYGKISTRKWLKSAFSRVSDGIIQNLIKEHKIPKSIFDQSLLKTSEDQFRKLYKGLQEAKLMAPTTKSVMKIGEAELAKSIQRLGEIDFFSVVSRKPNICDFKPVLIEVAIARRSQTTGDDRETPVQILRFANRVPLQFDKGSCAIVKSIESVNWKAYGLSQPRKSLPQGPYVFAISLVSPFIKFKNASKETVDASDELVDELRKALIQCGQRLGAHIRREAKEADMERKIQHIEQFAPILVQALCRITKSNKTREKKAMDGLSKILGRDSKEQEKELKAAEQKVKKVKARLQEKLDKSESVKIKKIKDLKKQNPKSKNQMELEIE